MNLRTKILTSSIGPLLLQVFILVRLGQLLHEAEDAVQLQLKVSQLQYLSSSLQKELNTSFSTALMYRITNSEKLRDSLQSNLDRIPPILNKLTITLRTSGYPESAITNLNSLGTTAISVGTTLLSDDPTSRYKDERQRFAKNSALIVRGMSEESARIDNFALQLNGNPENAARARARVINFLYLAFGADVLLACLLAAVNMVSIVNRVTILKENTVNLSLDQPLKATVGGDDELTELDNYFRLMAVSLEDSNKRRNALIKNTVDVLCSIDKNGKFVSVSNASKKIWGFEPESLIGKPAAQLMPQAERAFTQASLKTAIESKVDQVFDNKIVKSDGSFAEMRWSVTWSEKDTCLFCVVRDISRDNELTRMKQALMDTAAHDLRTPLTAIVATLSNLSIGVFGDLSPEVKTKLAKTENEAKRLVRLVSELLDSEKLTAGKLHYSKASTSIRSLVDEAVSSVAPIAEKMATMISVESLPDINLVIDKERILQVVVNLLANAIKHSLTETSITITGQAESDIFAMQIIDHGQGIPDAEKEKVFERFAQAKASETSDLSSGLGLTIARSIIDGHGGKIGVKDTEGGGCTFWFTLPTGH